MRISDWSSDVCSSDLDAERFAEEDKKRRESAEAKNSADRLVHTTERQLADHGDKIDAALKSEIETAIEAAKKAVASDNVEEMKRTAEALANVAMKLGQALYEQDQAAY